jgi:cell fate regulator YaaT (PSP1 superfamily)
MNLETQKKRKQRGRMMEGGKYEREWYDDSSKNHPVATLFQE